MSPCCSTEVRLHQVGLHDHLAHPVLNVELLVDDALNKGCREARNRRWEGSSSLSLDEAFLLVVEVVALGQCPVAIVLDPIGLVVPGVCGKIEEAQ